jgi:hypothetical protein
MVSQVPGSQFVNSEVIDFELLVASTLGITLNQSLGLMCNIELVRRDHIILGLAQLRSKPLRISL